MPWIGILRVRGKPKKTWKRKMKKLEIRGKDGWK
jgi:hypothetical protein